MQHFVAPVLVECLWIEELRREIGEKFRKVYLGSLLYMQEGVEYAVKLWEGFQRERRRILGEEDEE